MQDDGYRKQEESAVSNPHQTVKTLAHRRATSKWLCSWAPIFVPPSPAFANRHRHLHKWLRFFSARAPLRNEDTRGQPAGRKQPRLSAALRSRISPENSSNGFAWIAQPTLSMLQNPPGMSKSRLPLVKMNGFARQEGPASPPDALTDIRQPAHPLVRAKN